MPLSDVQTGVLAVYELAQLLMIGSNGLLEVSFPASDDERRDAEVHIREQFGESMALQVKCSKNLQMPPTRKTPLLVISFRVREAHLVTDPRLNYHLSWFPVPKEIHFMDPQYFVSSVKLHRYASPRLVNGFVYFNFSANLAPNSRDKWVPDKVYGKGIALVVLKMLEGQEKLPRAQRPSEPFRLPPGAIVIRRTR